MATSSSSSPPEGMRNHDLLAVRSYVMARDETQYDTVDDALVVLDVTHSNLEQRHAELRFAKHDSLETLRTRIHQKTGTSAQFQHLLVYDNHDDNSLLHEIPPETSDDIKLGYFGILHHGMRVHCVDLNPHSGSAGGAYEDVSLVEKYRMTEDEYDARKGTLRDWGRQQRERQPDFNLRKHAATHRALTEAKRLHKQHLPLPEGFIVDSTGKVVVDEPDVVAPIKMSEMVGSDEYGLDSVAHCQVGQRCQVEPGQRRGEIAFIGKLSQEKPGHWVGVRFDEPVGQNNGVDNGVVFFEAMDRYGAFVRGKKVVTGDFPERDIFDSDDEDEL
jgi:tubulin-folding cofactor B